MLNPEKMQMGCLVCGVSGEFLSNLGVRLFNPSDSRVVNAVVRIGQCLHDCVTLFFLPWLRN